MEEFTSFLLTFKKGLVSVIEWIETHSDLVTATATIAIAAFTLTLWWATRKLWQTAQEQSRDMKTSLRIAQEAADAAKKSADALPAIERAYLFVKVILDRYDHDPGEVLREMPGVNKVEIIVTNHGKTPAILKRFTIFNNIYFSEKIDLLFPFGTEIIESGKHAIYFTRFFIHDANEWQEVTGDESNLICQGIVQYSDVFDVSQIEVVFCWQWNELSEKFDPCTEGNYRKQIN